MTQTAQDAELDEAIAAAELDDDEAAKVRELVAGGGITAAAIEHVLAARDTPDDEELPGDTPDAPPPAAFVVNEKKVEKEIERHLTAMAELLGPTAEAYEPCEECGAVGLRIAGPTMKAHEMYRACPTCDGYGKVLTGSKDPQWAAQACPGCAGRGFQTRSTESGAPASIAGAVVEQGDGFGPEAWMGDPTLQPAASNGGWS